MSSFIRAFSATARAIPASLTTGDVTRIEFDARRRQRFGLAELGAADPVGAGRDLAAGDLRTLVSLGVWPQADPDLLRVRSHVRDVALERIEIDQKRRSLELRAAAGNANEIELRLGPSMTSHSFNTHQLVMTSESGPPG